MLMFLDGEWNSYGGDLISLALVTIEGDEWYEVLPCAAPHPWVAENVIERLRRAPVSLEEMRASLLAFLRRFESAEIIVDWPEDIAYFANVMVTGPGQRLDWDGGLSFEIVHDLPNTADTSALPHNALEDAKALRRSWIEANDE